MQGFNRAGVSARFQQVRTHTSRKAKGRFNRAGVSARFQQSGGTQNKRPTLVVSIEPAFPPDSNMLWRSLARSKKSQSFNRAGVSARFQLRDVLKAITEVIRFNRAGVSARFQQDVEQHEKRQGYLFQSSRRFRQIPTLPSESVSATSKDVSIEPAFPPDSNIKMLFFEAFKPTGFNRAGVSARFQQNLFQHALLNSSVSIEPAFPPDSNKSTPEQQRAVAEVSIEPAFPPDSNNLYGSKLYGNQVRFNRAGVSARFQHTCYYSSHHQR